MNKNKTFNVKRDFLIIMAFLWLSSLPICAQNITVRGNVVDEQKEPLIGVSVKIQGTTIGTVTDYDGNFELPNVPPEGKLEFSYVGMKTLIVPVNGRTMINVTMQEDVEMLEEVVITGYGGTQLRSRSTHSIAKVENKKLEVGIFSNPGQALSGAVSGLRVVQYSGNPGATPTIVLRGGTNLDGSGSPLVIVDGQVRGSLSDINPEDIENMQVMKDAGATAIYGARANNGVILIQTKRGKKGVSEMNFKMKVGANYLNLPYEFCNAEEYLTWMRPSYVKSAQIWQRENGTWVGYSNPITLTGTQPYGTGNAYFADDGVTPLENTMNSVWSTMYYEDRYQFLIDKHGWQKMKDPVYEYIKSISKDPNSVPEYLIFRNTYPGDFNFKDPSYSQDYNWNMSGGNDKGSYYTSLGYNYSQGLPVSSYYKRYSITANGDYKIKPWLTSFSNFNFTRANWQSMPPSQTSEANYFSRILTVPPTVRYVNEHDGSYRLGNNYSDGNQAYQPDKFFRLNQTDKFTMNQTLKIDFAKNMNLKLSGNWYYSEGFYEAFNKDFRENPTKINTTRNSSGEFGRTIDQTYNAIFNYDTQINDHYLSVMLGSEYYDTYSYGIYAAGSGAPTDDFRDLGLTSSEENKRFIDSYHTKQRILSFFGRANYNWQEKYLLSLVLRHDGYSRLVNNRWGTFPGISAGWIFSKESFMDELDEILSFGKLRASYGLNGNVSGIGAYELQGSYVASTKYNGLATFVLGSVPNPDLRWEKTRTFEVGLDLSYLNNRYSTNFTFYDRLTSDKFATLSLPCSSGISGIRTNNGEFRNRGVEIELSAIPIQNSNWYWNIGANISYNKNTVVSLPYNGLPLNRQGGFQVYSGKNETDLIWVGGYQEGKEPGVLYAFKAEGIYKDESEIPDDMIVKRHSFQGATTRPSYGKNNWANMSEQEKINSGGFPIQPGDVKWKDVNGDNIIDDFDLVKVGNTTPHWFGGFNTTVTWKKLSLYCAFDYAFDFWVMDYRLPWILGNMQGTYNMTTDVRKTWTPENPKAKYPAYVWADQLGKGNYRNSTLFSYRGDYLSLRQVSLSYSLPRELINKAFIEKLDLSITGQNLGYITAAKTVATPERGGIQDATYTLPRTVIFGLNITF